MKTLEEELAELRAKINELDERLRLRRVAETFPASPILDGDFFQDGGFVGQCVEWKRDGKVVIVNTGASGGWEGNPPLGWERLYTRAEVQAILDERAGLKA